MRTQHEPIMRAMQWLSEKGVFGSKPPLMRVILGESRNIGIEGGIAIP